MLLHPYGLLYKIVANKHQILAACSSSLITRVEESHSPFQENDFS